MKNSPKFAFGHGLSYTTFTYADLKLSKNKISDSDTIEVSFQLTNSGKFAGNEVVQLYLRDKVGSVVRPIIELKDFQKIYLNAGETKTIQFTKIPPGKYTLVIKAVNETLGKPDFVENSCWFIKKK
mgnify:CR=1 FL=1